MGLQCLPARHDLWYLHFSRPYGSSPLLGFMESHLVHAHSSPWQGPVETLIDFCPLSPCIGFSLLAPCLTNASHFSSLEPGYLPPQPSLPPLDDSRHVVGTVSRRKGRSKCGVIVGFNTCFPSEEHCPSLHSISLLKRAISFILFSFIVVSRKRESLAPVTLCWLEVDISVITEY